MATTHNDDVGEILFKQNSCNIILKQGNLLDENNVDVIVIPTPNASEPKPDNFQIFKAILERTNEQCRRKIDRLRMNLTPDKPQVVLETEPRYIFAMPPYLGNPTKAYQYLRNTYTACLNLAVEQYFRTIAFPTIGCGVIGFEAIAAARSVYQALDNFGQSKNKTKLNEIRIVIYDKDVWHDFTTTFIELSHQKNAKIKLIDISTRNSHVSEMPSRNDAKQTSHNNETHNFDGESNNNQHDPARSSTSNLNPESPVYQPINKNQRRIPRHYRINENRTELIIFQGDILTTKVDAIVNAANEPMLGGGGVDGVIHTAAGDELRKACKAHKEIYRDVRLPTGRSRILLSYGLSKTTHYIINTAGPCYDDTTAEKCKEDLRSCYKTSLALANLYDLETIAYTAISCGIFGYPIDEGAEVALSTVDREAGSMRRINFVLRNDDTYDAWIKKADELGFISQDDPDIVTASTSSKSTDNTKDATQKSNRKDERIVTEQSDDRRIIDASTPNNKDRVYKTSAAKSPDRQSSHSPKQFDNQTATKNKDNDSTSRQDDTSEKEKSLTPTNNNHETQVESNNSQNQKKTQKRDQPQQPVASPKNTNKSIVVVGRGRVKPK
ncbi:unnamed protein product [Adineta steineri]|uniref:Macro domain-containing protein n=2 Tax=Adineta steineri TaxID=433720 RepID=A0A814HFD8_9BILA|nr:unnamed protein product [Adineta steineri]